jgi:transcription antitermination factor NusG
MTPVWHALITLPRREASAQAWLAQRGIEAWYPVETRWRVLRRGRVRRRPYEAVIVGGYIFARFRDEPVWEVVRECRFLRGVIAYDCRPIPITDEVMAQMAQVPARLEALRRREAERRLIRPGDRVVVTEGPLAGWTVDVHEVHAGIARFLTPLGEAEVARLEKRPAAE